MPRACALAQTRAAVLPCSCSRVHSGQCGGLAVGYFIDKRTGGPREESHLDRGAHQERSGASDCPSRAPCGREAAGTSPSEPPFPICTFPGGFLLASRVQIAFILKNAPQSFEAAPCNSRHCSLQIKGTAVPFYQAQERGQPPRGAHARPAEGGGGLREEGEATVLTGRPGLAGARWPEEGRASAPGAAGCVF